MTVKVDLETVESFLVFWDMVAEKQKVGDRFLQDIAKMPQFEAVYDEDFTGNSLVKVLSAVANRELLNGMTKREGRFWNNNLWILENPGMASLMAEPIKSMSIDLPAEKKVDQVVFVPMTTEEYFWQADSLYINFFRIMASEWQEKATLDEKPVKEYIEDKINSR